MTTSQKARTAGVLYLLTFVTGIFALVAGRGTADVAANIVADVCYVGVTFLFYDMFKPVNKAVSLIAALFSLTGCVVGLLFLFHLERVINALPFFGVYCILLGYLIWQSGFIPQVIGALMMFAGMGWLTFISVALARSLSPYVYLPGVIGEGALTLWLLIRGIDTQRWKALATAALQ